MNLEQYIAQKKNRSKKLGYSTPKYITFIEHMLKYGFYIHIRPAKRSVSKYIYLTRDNVKKKIRFSTHPQSGNDCDYCVGVQNDGAYLSTSRVCKKIFQAYNIKDWKYPDKE